MKRKKPKQPREIYVSTEKRIPVQEGGHLTGTKITDVQKIAEGREIKEVDTLVQKYGGEAKNWKKLKGIALIQTYQGTKKYAEIHWYECHGVGRVKWKRKRWLD